MCKFIRGYENRNNDISIWIHWLQLTLITVIETRKQGGGRCQGTGKKEEKTDRNSEETNILVLKF